MGTLQGYWFQLNVRETLLKPEGLNRINCLMNSDSLDTSATQVSMTCERYYSVRILNQKEEGWPVRRPCARMLCYFSHVQLSATPWTVVPQAPLFMDSPDKNTGLGCHAFLQGIFQTQGSNPCLLWLLHWRWILYCWATGEAPVMPS